MGLVKYSLGLRPQLILPKVIYAHNILVDIQHIHTFGMIVCVCVCVCVYILFFTKIITPTSLSDASLCLRGVIIMHVVTDRFTKSWLVEATVSAMLIALGHDTEYGCLHYVYNVTYERRITICSLVCSYSLSLSY